MKNLYLIIIIFLSVLGTQSIIAQNEFITHWIPSNGEIVIPTNSQYPNYNYNVTWKKLGAINPLGSHSNVVENDTIVTGIPQGSNDTIEVKITGNFPAFYMNNGFYKDELIDITQWGNIQWQSFERSFYGCSNLKISATDTPNLSSVFSMAEAFKQAINFNSYIGDWDVSQVTNMNSMFFGASAFNQDISGWNLTSATDLGSMFHEANAFNQDISNWNVSNVNTMNFMFYQASAFNGDIGRWDVSNVSGFDSILYNATNFNQSLEDWNLSGLSQSGKITLSNCGMSCTNYSRTLYGWAHNPNTPNGIVLENDGLERSVDDLIENVINILTGPKAWTMTNYNTGSCTGIVTGSFITVWNTENSGTTTNNQVLVPADGEFSYTFEMINYPAGDTITGNGGSGNNLSSNTIQFTNPGTYRISITPLGQGGVDFHRITFNEVGDPLKLLAIEQWGNFIPWSSLNHAYHGCSNLDVTATDIPKLKYVTNTAYAFAETGLSTLPNFNNWDLSNVTDMSHMFKGVDGFMPDMGDWDVSNVTDMSGMFAGAGDFNQDISGWDVSNVTNMSHMFDGATSFDQDLSGWDVSNVTDMSYMFSGASSITNIGPIEGELHPKANDLGNWDVGQVTNMEGMFQNAVQFNGDLGNWDVGQVTNMANMFSGATQYNGDLGNWDVGQVTNMSNMFSGATQYNGDLGNWDVGQVTNMSNMFSGATQFNGDLGNWDVGQLGNGITGVPNHISFANSGMDCSNYSLTLQGWANQAGTASNVLLDATGISYSPDVVNERTVLINNKNWTITGDAEDPNCFLSIDELEASSFVIYPNPAQAQLTISGLNGNETIVLKDMTGRIVQSVNNNTNQTTQSISVNQLASGVYNLIISTENGQNIVKQLIKQ